jgi:hypothetical protein
VECGELIIGNTSTGGVLIAIQLTSDKESRLGGRGSNEIYDHFMAQQRLASPVLCNGREQAVLDLVPFAGSRWKVTHRDFEPRFVRKLLQLDLP